MRGTKLVGIIIGLFFLIHAFPFVRSFLFVSGIEGMNEDIIVGAGWEEREIKFDKLKNLCYKAQCDVLRYNFAHSEFRSHASLIGSSEGFYERLTVLSGGVHPVDELGWIDDGQEEIKNGWIQSKRLFTEASHSNILSVSNKGEHNKKVLALLLGEDLSEGDISNESENNDKLTSGEETKEEGLSEKEKQELQEYAEYLKDQQERYQDNFNSRGQKKEIYKGLEIIDELLRPEQKTPGGDDVIDW